MTEKQKNIDAWSTAGAAKGITGSFVGTQWFTIDSGCNAVLFDLLMASVAAPTNVEAQLLWSPDGGVTSYGPLDVVNGTSTGTAEVQDLVVQTLSTADGHHTISIGGLSQGMSYCLQLRCTGGTTPTAIVKGFVCVL